MSTDISLSEIYSGSPFSFCFFKNKTCRTLNFQLNFYLPAQTRRCEQRRGEIRFTYNVFLSDGLLNSRLGLSFGKLTSNLLPLLPSPVSLRKAFLCRLHTYPPLCFPRSLIDCISRMKLCKSISFLAFVYIVSHCAEKNNLCFN